MNKKIIVLLSVCIFILLTIWGYNSLYDADTPNNNENINLNNASDAIDVSDWVEYRNEELGFEFKHPGDWIVELRRVNYGIHTADEVYFYITVSKNNPSESNRFSKLIITTFENIKGKSPEEVIAINENFSLNEFQSLFLDDFLLNGVIVKKYMIPGFISLPALIFYSNDKVHQIKYSLEEDMFMEIMDTFKSI